MIAAIELIEKNISEKEIEINDMHEHYPVEVGDKGTWQCRNVLRLDKEVQEMYEALKILKEHQGEVRSISSQKEAKEVCDCKDGKWHRIKLKGNFCTICGVYCEPKQTD